MTSERSDRVDVVIDVEEGLEERGMLAGFPSRGERVDMITTGRTRDLDRLDELKDDIVTSVQLILGAAGETISATHYDNRWRLHTDWEHAANPNPPDADTFIEATWASLTLRHDSYRRTFTATASVGDDAWVVQRPRVHRVPASTQIAERINPDPILLDLLPSTTPPGAEATPAILSECTWLRSHPQDLDGRVIGPAITTIIHPAGTWALDHRPDGTVTSRHSSDARDLARSLSPATIHAREILDRLRTRGMGPQPDLGLDQ